MSHIPDVELDLSVLDKPLLPEESDAAQVAFCENEPGFHRRLAANIKAHPEKLLSWDMPISIDEYIRRVEAGEFD